MKIIFHLIIIYRNIIYTRSCSNNVKMNDLVYHIHFICIRNERLIESVKCTVALIQYHTRFPFSIYLPFLSFFFGRCKRSPKVLDEKNAESLLITLFVPFRIDISVHLFKLELLNMCTPYICGQNLERLE